MGNETALLLAGGAWRVQNKLHAVKSLSVIRHRYGICDFLFKASVEMYLIKVVRCVAIETWTGQDFSALVSLKRFHLLQDRILESPLKVRIKCRKQKKNMLAVPILPQVAFKWNFLPRLSKSTHISISTSGLNHNNLTNWFGGHLILSFCG